MFRYFIRLRYKGTAYHGWQIQQNAISIQQVVNESLSNVLRQPIETTGCGRTDTGVHAEMFFAHFDSLNQLTETDKIIGKLAAQKREGIEFQEIIPVNNQSHARFDAISRSYEYRIIRTPNPFLFDRAYYVYGQLDIDKMKMLSNDLLGKKDFGAFSKSNTQVKTNICNITEALWFERGEELVFKVSADRFLRNMVRAIVGTLLDAGQGRKTPDNLLKIIESKSRSNAGMSVPACGLFLTNVEYPKEIFQLSKEAIY